MKLSCLGVPDINKPSVRGDHYFIVNVLIPKDIRSVFFLPSFLISLKKEFIIDFLFSVLPVPKVYEFLYFDCGSQEQRFSVNILFTHQSKAIAVIALSMTSQLIDK